ncbi:MAG: NADPH:quinone oxidoreductase family protein [Pseudomonadota bacterium]
MRVYQISEHNVNPSLVDIAMPIPAEDEILIRIMACGLNFADLLMIKGKYQDLPALPTTLGLELAGIVEATGDCVKNLHVGQRVAVYSGHGGLAEYGVFPADRCLPIPDDMPFEIAAGFQIAYGSSHLALDRCARLQPGETLFVSGAAGGVGLTAVEIGKHMGARVIASARGEEKLQVAKAAGADVLIDATDGTELRTQLKDLGGVDVVYDTIGGDTYTGAFRACNPEGRVLLIGFAGGDLPEIKPNHMLVKNISVIGFYWGGYLKFNPKALTDSLATLLEWYSAGHLKPHVSHILPLDRADEGLELLRSRKATGKVVITPHA